MGVINMRSRVTELKKEGRPRVRWGDIFEESDDGITVAQAVALDDYFFHFMLEPLDEEGCEVCPCCRERIKGGVEGALLGCLGVGVHLEWGLAHGEALCSGCGWPYRVLHYNIGGKDEDALIKRLVLALPYHPSELTSHPARDSNKEE